MLRLFIRDRQERWQANFNPRAVAPVADLPAKPEAERIPFHVMCGSLDTRLPVAKEFVASLKKGGYNVRFESPHAPHGPTEPEHVAEWEKFRRRAIEFFLEVTKGQ